MLGRYLTNVEVLLGSCFDETLSAEIQMLSSTKAIKTNQQKDC